MKTVKSNLKLKRDNILHALKMAIVEGASWRYAQLVNSATEAGATDEEIDDIASEAIQALLTGAEQPVTARELAHDWPVSQVR